MMLLQPNNRISHLFLWFNCSCRWQSLLYDVFRLWIWPVKNLISLRIQDEVQFQKYYIYLN